MIDEDTGEEPKCVFCHAVDECEHLVACIDRTFCECGGGAMHDRDWEFRSCIEDVFLTLLKSGSETHWADIDIQRLWDQAKLDYDSEKAELDLDLCILANLIIQLLQNSGAVDYPGPVRDEGGPPGFTSSYSLLYAENPGAVVDEALERLKLSLGHPRPKREEADKELIIIADPPEDILPPDEETYSSDGGATEPARQLDLIPADKTSSRNTPSTRRRQEEEI